MVVASTCALSASALMKVSVARVLSRSSQAKQPVLRLYKKINTLTV